MPKKTSKTKKSSDKAGKARKRRRSRPEVIVEEETTRVVPVTRTAVRAEPVTLARALGETAVIEERVEPRVMRTVKKRRKRA